MSNYVKPTLAEFEAILLPEGFQLIEVKNTRELVFAKRVDQDNQPLSLRVFSSLEPDGQGRECGEDAIRVEVNYRTSTGEIRRVGGSRRVNRVAGWQARLLERVTSWQENLGPTCACGAPTVLRDGKFGKFYGCSEYPRCTRKINLVKQSEPK